MKKKAILEKCQILTNTIDGLQHDTTPLYEDFRRSTQIRMFVDDVIDEEKFYNRVLKSFKGLESDQYDEMLNRFFSVSFAIGFAAGQIVELPDKAVNRDIVSLVKVMKGKKLLPIFPRERRARGSRRGVGARSAARSPGGRG